MGLIGTFAKTSYEYSNSVLPLNLRTFIVAILFALTSVSCTKSPPPTVEDLIKVGSPKFGGLSVKSFTTPSQTYTLTGECDQTSRNLEYSYDNSTWVKFASSCPTGTFSIPMTITGGFVDIWVRAWGKFSATGAAKAHIRFLLPPTSPLLTFVSSSRSDLSDKVGAGSQNAIGDFATGEPMSSAANLVQTYVPGVVYSE